MNPTYKHDCSHCNFLGTVLVEGTTYDLYHHASSAEDTVIARFSSDGPDYNSGACFSYSGNSPALTAARLRAQQMGLMKYSITSALRYAEPGTYCFTELVEALGKTAVSELMQAIQLQSPALALNVWNSLEEEEAKFIKTNWFDLLRIYSISDNLALMTGPLRQDCQI